MPRAAEEATAAGANSNTPGIALNDSVTDSVFTHPEVNMSTHEPGQGS
jgi:hypothetical protein